MRNLLACMSRRTGDTFDRALARLGEMYSSSAPWAKKTEAFIYGVFVFGLRIDLYPGVIFGEYLW